MDNKLQIRLLIGDQLQTKLEYFTVKDGQTSFMLERKGVNSIVSVKVNQTEISSADYTINDNILTITHASVVTDAIVEVVYKFACLMDTELDFALTQSGNNVTAASVKAIDWLIADAAKLYNYSTGDESMSQAVIFDHLREIRASLQNTVTGEALQVPRIYSIKQKEPHMRKERDISRWDY